MDDCYDYNGYYDEIARCACGKGHVIRHLAYVENDWKVDDIHLLGHGITCRDCQKTYHLEGSKDHEYLVPNDASNGERIRLHYAYKKDSYETPSERKMRLAFEALGAPPTYEFRKARKGDAEALGWLRHGFYASQGWDDDWFCFGDIKHPGDDYGKSVAAEILNDRTLVVYIACVNEDLPCGHEIGYIVMEYEKECVRIKEIYVNSYFRRKGIASALLDKCVKAAKRRRIRNIKFDYEEDGRYGNEHIPAQEFCKAAGFKTKVVQTEKRI